MTAYLVAGTQAETSQQNFIILMKMSQLKQTIPKDEEEEDSKHFLATVSLIMSGDYHMISGDDETLDDDEPQLDTVMIVHAGGVNRLRVRFTCPCLGTP